MSFVSRAHSIVLVNAQHEKKDYTIAKLLNKIAKSLKIKRKNLEKLSFVDGNMRWLQYTYRKKAGGGFLYITRHEDVFVYVLIFNFNYSALANDLPFIERYIQELSIESDI
ncbi:MAG: hypothetical protein LDLANPLL_00572 [Turneriella sp.]|nr:hypothetical protein [Turneriella sp.]